MFRIFHSFFRFRIFIIYFRVSCSVFYLYPPDTFFYDGKNLNIEPNDNWDFVLGNMGIIPKTVEKYIYDLLDEDNKGKLKYVMSDISNAIMEQNIEIWKYRCKMLYANRENENPP